MSIIHSETSFTMDACKYIIKWLSKIISTSRNLKKSQLPEH